MGALKTRSAHQARLCATSSRIALSAIACALMMPAALAQNANGQQLETVVVTGLRETLDSAIQIKRNSPQVVDTIVAADIGKLNASGVQEAMTAIPGVQGYRYAGEGASPAGAGSGLTIRGFASQTGSRLNGRVFFTAQSRNFNVEEAVPGMVGAIQVYKNPAADQIDGAIGGVVNLVTRKPFDFDGFVLNLSAEGRINDLVGSPRPEYFGLISDRWSVGSLGEMGLTFSADYQVTRNRSDNNPAGGGANLRTATQIDATTWSLSSNVAGVDPSKILTISGVNSQVNIEDITKTRIGFDLEYQWKLSDQLQVYADSTYMHYLYEQSYQFMNVIDSNTVQNLVTTPYNMTNGFVNRGTPAGTILATQRFLSGTFIGDTAQTTGGFESHPYTTWIVGGGVIWDPTADLHVKVDAAYISASQLDDNRSVSANTKAGLTWNVTRGETTKPHQIAFSGPDLANPQNWVLAAFNTPALKYWDDNGVAFTADATYKTHFPVLTDIRFGFRYATQNEIYHDYAFTAAKNLTTNGAALAADQSNGISAATVSDLFKGTVTNWMGGAAGYSGGFITFSPRQLLNNMVSGRFTAAGIPTQLVGPKNNNAPENLANFYNSHDTSFSGYVMADFALFDGKVEGDLGLRVVSDTIKSTAMVNLNPGYVPNTKSASGVDALPDFNATWHVTDDFQARFSYAKSLYRPELSQVVPNVTVDITNGAAGGTGSVGNPNLGPERADSYDVTFEWYPIAHTAIAIDFFDKETKGFFVNVSQCQTVDVYGPYTGTTVQPCTGGQWYVSKTVNAGPGYARGIEIGAQTFFDYLGDFWGKFGAQFSYTYLDTSNPVRFVTNGPLIDVPLPMQSKNSGMLALLYDDGDLQSRLAYTYRSQSVLFGISAQPTNGRYIRAYGLLDWSASYKVADTVEVYTGISNITNTALDRFFGEPGQYASPLERQHYDNGRIYNFGIRFKTGN